MMIRQIAGDMVVDDSFSHCVLMYQSLFLVRGASTAMRSVDYIAEEELIGLFDVGQDDLLHKETVVRLTRVSGLF